MGQEDLGDIRALSTVLGDKVEEWLGAADPKTKFVLILVKGVGEGSYIQAATASAGGSAEAIGGMLVDIGEEILKGNGVEFIKTGKGGN